MTEPQPALRPRRQRRRTLTDNMIAKLPRRATAYFFPDPELVKHGVRVRPSGPGTFTVIVRDTYGKQRWIRVGSTDAMTVGEARDIAREVIKRVEAGKTPFELPPVQPDSIEAVVRKWLKRHVGLDLPGDAAVEGDKKGDKESNKEGDKKAKLRTAHEIRRIVQKYILPHWGSRNFVEIKRRDVADLLDHIEDNHSARTADTVLTTLRSVAAWLIGRGDVDADYISPFRGIGQRVPKAKRKRDRKLDDGEIRRVWKVATYAGAYGAFVRLALYTGQRASKLIDLKWHDVDLDTGVWTIATEEGEKPNARSLLLPAQALAIIRAQPKFATSDFVFANNRGFHSRHKAQLDQASGVHGWKIHDLRRSAKSLMAKAGYGASTAKRFWATRWGRSMKPTTDTNTTARKRTPCGAWRR